MHKYRIEYTVTKMLFNQWTKRMSGSVQERCFIDVKAPGKAYAQAMFIVAAQLDHGRYPQFEGITRLY
jgi:hypothetical protein